MRPLQESDFGLRLKLCRQWLGLTQQELGVALGTTERTISAYESLLRFPHTSQVRQMSEALGVPFEWLCGLGPTFAWENNTENTEDNAII